MKSNGEAMHPKFLKGTSSVANLRKGMAGNQYKANENGEDNLTNLHYQNMNLLDPTDPAQTVY